VLIDDMSINDISVDDDMSVDDMSVDDMSVDDMKTDDMSVDDMSIDDDIKTDDIKTEDIYNEMIDTIEDFAFRMCADLNDITPNVKFMTRSEYIQKLREERFLTLAEFNIAAHCNYFTTIRLNCIEHYFDDYSKEYLPEQCCSSDCNCRRKFFFGDDICYVNIVKCLI
jgi:hypothetical protein